MDYKKEFERDGFYAVQCWLSYGSRESIYRIEGGLVVFKKSDWLPVGEYFGDLEVLAVQYLDSFEI